MPTPTIILRRLLQGLTACALPCIPSILLAQTAESVAAEEVVELSPFTVSISSDAGYRATETLSGTRLRTSVDNVGASIDILTEDFLKDVGAVDMLEALDYVGNVSTWAQSGSNDASDNREWWSIPYTARGFQADSVMTDFFSRGEFSTDSYNTESLTISRGPNAVLYGVGQPGGIVNASRKRAMFGSDFYNVSTRFDSEDGARVAVDVNRELIPNKLGIRGAAVYSDKGDYLRPSKDVRRGYYGSMTWKPTPTTNLTVAHENATHDRILRSNNIPYNAVTPWLNAGRPTDLEFGRPYGTNDTSPGSGMDRLTGSNRIVVIAGQSLPIMNWRNAARSEYIEIPGHFDARSVRRQSFNESNAIIPMDVYIGGVNSTIDYDLSDTAIFLEQKLIDNMYLELAFNKSDFSYDFFRFGRHGDSIFVDPNEQLPNGAPNPNVGLPYYEIDRSEQNYSAKDRQTLRATLSYEFDLNGDRKFGLGHYSLFGMAERFEMEELYSGSFRNINSTPLPGFSSNWANSQNRIRRRTYLQSSITPAGTPGTFYTWNNEIAPIDRDGVKSLWVRTGAPRQIFDTRDSVITAIQADYWKADAGFNRISAMYGYRYDENSSRSTLYRKTANNVYEGTNFAHNFPTREEKFDAAVDYGVLDDPAESLGPTGTYSLMLRPTSNLTFYYQFSDVMIATTSLKPNIYGEANPPTLGDTQDFGVRFNALDNRVAGSLTYFTTAANDQLINNIRGDIGGDLERMFRAIDPNHQFEELDERWHGLRTDQTEGMEFQVVGNISNWRARLSVSQQNTTILSQLPIVDRFATEYEALWAQNANTPLEDLSDPNEQTVSDLHQQVKAEIANYHSLEGSAPAAQREWKTNLTLNYSFTEGSLKGFGVGGGYRWEAADTIGYQVDPATKIVIADKPFKGDPITRLDARISYKFKMFENVGIRLQLNVRNVLDDTEPFVRNAIDDGNGNPSYGRYQLQGPRTYVLSADFNF